MRGMADEVHVVAKYDYAPADRQELGLHKGEKLLLLDDSRQWWRVENARRQTGYVPSNFVKRCKPSLLASLRNTLGRRKSTPTTAASSSSTTSSAQSSCCASPRSTAHAADAVSESSATGDAALSLAELGVAAVARYQYQARQPDELALTRGERVYVLEKSSDGWWRGRKASTGDVGWFPSNYMEPPDYDSGGSDAYASTPRKHKDAAVEAASFIDSLTRVGDGSNYCGPSAGLGRANMRPVGAAVALYPFTSSNPREELSFDKDERLEILDRPAVDPEWWRARNARGEVGLVPRNYVQTLSTDSGIQTTAQTTPESASSSSLSGGGGGGEGAETSCLGSGATSGVDGAITRVLGLQSAVSVMPSGSSESKSGVLLGTVEAGSALSGATSRLREAVSDIAVLSSLSSETAVSQSSGVATAGTPCVEVPVCVAMSACLSASSLAALPPVPPGPYATRDWFFSAITRADCEQMLNSCADNGDFLVRESETNVGDYTLTLKAPHRNKHFRIIVDQDSFGIGQQVFRNLDDLVEHYKKHPIYRHANERLYLIKAFSRRAAEDSAVVSEHPAVDVAA